VTGFVHALLNGLVPLTNGLDPNVAWDIRGVVFPIVAILVVALGGFRGLQPVVTSLSRQPCPSRPGGFRLRRGGEACPG
jgi:hypothetical protein